MSCTCLSAVINLRVCENWEPMHMGWHTFDSCEYSMYVLVINLRVRDIGNLCIGVGTRFDSLVETLGHSLKFYVLVE